MVLKIFKRVFICLLVTSSLSYAAIMDAYAEFNFRAWGIGGNVKFSQVTFKIDKDSYTAIALSQKSISQEKASLSGDFTVLVLHIRDKIKQIKLSSDYKNSKIVIKVYKSSKIFNDTTLVYETNSIYLNEDYIDQNIEIN